MNEAVPGWSSADFWQAAVATCCGTGHKTNEDACGAWPEFGVFAIADGMGGHRDGGLASSAIVEMVGCVLAPELDIEVRVALVEEALEAVNGALRRLARQKAPYDIIGSTIVALVLSADMAVCLWAGDSRIYLFQDGRLQRLTTDHTLLQESDLDHGRSNVLTRAVGSTDTLQLDRSVVQIGAESTLLLCSDGLTKALRDEEIAVFMKEPLEGLADRIVARAVASGGRDDISAVIVRRELF